MNMRLSIFITFFLLLGCSETPTSLRVHLVYEKSWSLDRVELSLAELSDETTITNELTILLPESLTGKTQTLRVSAFHSEERFAYGETEVIPLPGAEVQVTITLTRLPCGAWCQPGQTECRGDGIVICEQRDDDHCFEWSERILCSEDAPYCSLGQCADECIHECAEGELRCAGPNASQTCGQGDSDPCLEWLEEIPCAHDEICSAGTCRSQCIDECTAGEVECSGRGIRTCGDLNLDDCLEWGPSRACPAGESCDEGECKPIEECRDECLESDCTGLTFHECGQFDLDPCRDRSPGMSCVPSDLCLEGSCSPEGCATETLVCNDPGEPECTPDDKLHIPEREGTCSEGECRYTTRVIDCPNCAIIAGEPNCDTCRDVSCNDAPEPRCVDDSVLRKFAVSGECQDGECTYPFEDTECPNGCETRDGLAFCTDECASCTPRIFSDEEGTAIDLALDEGYLYWTDNGYNRIRRRRILGGDIETLATSQVGAFAIVLDETHLYWTSRRHHRVMRRSKHDDDTEIVVSSQTDATGLALDEQHVYWTSNSSDWVRRAGIDDRDVETIARRQNGTANVIVDETHVYWTSVQDYTLHRWPKTGGDIELLAEGQPGAARMAIDHNHVYWTNYFGDQVMRWNKQSRELETIATEQMGARGITLDDTHVYWVNERGGEIMRRAKRGGDIELIIRGEEPPIDIIVDDDNLYWSNSEHQILQLSRCACEL